MTPHCYFGVNYGIIQHTSKTNLMFPCTHLSLLLLFLSLMAKDHNTHTHTFHQLLSISLSLEKLNLLHKFSNI